ncbi:MAG: hypothetical protein Q9163_002309 [Psora crenata]
MIPIIIVRLIYLNSSSRSLDHTFDDFATVMISSIHVNLSILAACMPFIKPVMDSLQTGILASDVHATNPNPDRNPKYALRWLGSSSADRTESELITPRDSLHGSRATVTSGESGEPWQRGSSNGSQERMIIRKMQTVEVQSANRDTLTTVERQQGHNLGTQRQ